MRFPNVMLLDHVPDFHFTHEIHGRMCERILWPKLKLECRQAGISFSTNPEAMAASLHFL